MRGTPQRGHRIIDGNILTIAGVVAKRHRNIMYRTSGSTSQVDGVNGGEGGNVGGVAHHTHHQIGVVIVACCAIGAHLEVQLQAVQGFLEGRQCGITVYGRRGSRAGLIAIEVEAAATADSVGAVRIRIGCRTAGTLCPAGANALCRTGAIALEVLRVGDGIGNTSGTEGATMSSCLKTRVSVSRSSPIIATSCSTRPFSM